MHSRLRRKAYQMILQKILGDTKQKANPGMIYGAKGDIDNRVILDEIQLIGRTMMLVAER
jgi:hypothetical protein